MKTDSFGRFPIVLAIEIGLGWNEGIQQVVEATTLAQQQQSNIYTAAQYGLEWNNRMKELAEENPDEIMNGYDDLSGLKLFMVAAMGNYHHLDTIYGIMRMCPEQISVLNL